MLSLDYGDSMNSNETKKTLGTLRPEFITGSTARLFRNGTQLVLRWEDPYPEKQHQSLSALFEKLNSYESEGIPFLGGIRLRFEMGPPRNKEFRNQYVREPAVFS